MNSSGIKVSDTDTSELKQKDFTNDLFKRIKNRTVLIGEFLTKDIDNNEYRCIIFIFFKDDNKCDISSYKKDGSSLTKIQEYSSKDIEYKVDNFNNDNNESIKTILFEDNVLIMNYLNQVFYLVFWQ